MFLPFVVGLLLGRLSNRRSTRVYGVSEKYWLGFCYPFLVARFFFFRALVFWADKTTRETLERCITNGDCVLSLILPRFRISGAVLLVLLKIQVFVKFEHSFTPLLPAPRARLYLENALFAVIVYVPNKSSLEVRKQADKWVPPNLDRTLFCQQVAILSDHSRARRIGAVRECRIDILCGERTSFARAISLS